MAPVDYPRSAAGAALGARLRRASAAIDADAARIYTALGVAFEQRWFGVVDALAREASLRRSASLAAMLGVSHAAVSQVRQALEQHGLVASVVDPGDSRRRRLALSPAGRALADRLAPLWAAFAEAAAEARSRRPAGSCSGSTASRRRWRAGRCTIASWRVRPNSRQFPAPATEAPIAERTRLTLGGGPARC